MYYTSLLHTISISSNLHVSVLWGGGGIIIIDQTFDKLLHPEIQYRLNPSAFISSGDFLKAMLGHA